MVTGDALLVFPARHLKFALPMTPVPPCPPMATFPPTVTLLESIMTSPDDPPFDAAEAQDPMLWTPFPPHAMLPLTVTSADRIVTHGEALLPGDALAIVEPALT